MKSAAVEYSMLERDLEADRELYDNVRRRIQEIEMEAELAASNVFVLDEAVPPTTPSSPRKLYNLVLAIVLGLAGGIGLALAAEYFDNRLRTPQEVERYLGLPNLGIVPDLQKLNGHATWRALAERTGGVSPNGGTGRELSPSAPAVVLDAYRTIRTNIQLSQAGESPRTILFTSATRHEGKTATALNTAILYAQMDAPILVIDADLRRPHCHEALRLANGSGLTEVLTGQCEPADVIRSARQTSLSFLPSGTTPPNPTELLGSPEMKEVLSVLRRQYAHIVIDAPPVSPVSDAVVLSTLVDGVVMVVDQDRTPRQAIQQACSKLEYARARVLGIVLNRVDVGAPGYSQYFEEYA